MGYINGADTREAILRASRQLFYDRGYDETTYEDIARVAHVNKGSIYYHFKAKEALRACIAHEGAAKNRQTVQAIFGSTPYLDYLDLSVYFYKLSADAHYRRFYTGAYYADRVPTSCDTRALFHTLSQLYPTQPWDYDQFLTTHAEALLLYPTLEQTVLFLTIAAAPDAYTHKEATRAFCALVARLFAIPDSAFVACWQRTLHLMPNIPYDTLSTKLGP